MNQNHLNSPGNYITELCKKYDNFILSGNFYSEMCEDAMLELSSVYNLKNVVKKPTCYKNIGNPSCIDPILTNKSRSFIKTSVIETGLLDFHRVTIMKTTFQKQTPKVLNYRNYKNFDNEKFNIDLVNKLNELNNHDLYGVNCDEFENIYFHF